MKKSKILRKKKFGDPSVRGPRKQVAADMRFAQEHPDRCLFKIKNAKRKISKRGTPYGRFLPFGKGYLNHTTGAYRE